ncbi:hypothetical protein BDN67DRAFT_976427 [Paxillus ammoniavirescens]|nr:hypothetical protein BDN67DRAFT_976427 [Paxillus ammoniavirescens]
MPTMDVHRLDLPGPGWEDEPEDILEEQDARLRENFLESLLSSWMHAYRPFSDTTFMMKTDTLGLVNTTIKKAGQTCAEGMDTTVILAGFESNGESWSLNEPPPVPHSLLYALLSAKDEIVSIAVKRVKRDSSGAVYVQVPPRTCVSH